MILEAFKYVVTYIQWNVLSIEKLNKESDNKIQKE